MKKKLLDTAMDLFSRYGYEDVSVDMICKHCNVTKGSFYYHYLSKDSLLSEYYTINTNNDLTDLLIKMIDIKDPLEKLWKIAGYYPEQNNLLNPSLNMHLMVANMEHGGKLYPVLIDNIIAYYSEVSNVLKKVTEEGQSQGIIKNEYDWGQLFELYCAAFHGLLVEWSATDGSFDLMERIYQYFLMIYKKN